MYEVCTPYGDVSITDDSVTITAERAHLYSWATRPGAYWPLSTLRHLDRVLAAFDRDGLVELIADGDAEDLSSDEFNAWSSDVLRDAALPLDHPVYPIAVGQFT